MYRVERYAPCCQQEVEIFSGDRVMMRATISNTDRTNLVHVHVNSTMQIYRDEILRGHGILIIHMSMIMPAPTQQSSLQHAHRLTPFRFYIYRINAIKRVGYVCIRFRHIQNIQQLAQTFQIEWATIPSL